MGLVVVGWQLEDEWFCFCVLFRSVSPCCAGSAAHDLAWPGVAGRLGRTPVHRDSSLLHCTACASQDNQISVGKTAWNGIGNIHCPMLIGRMCVSDGGFCCISVCFIEWSRVDAKSEAHSQTRASFFKSCVQRLANSIDFRACGFVVSVGKMDHSETV